MLNLPGSQKTPNKISLRKCKLYKHKICVDDLFLPINIKPKVARELFFSYCSLWFIHLKVVNSLIEVSSDERQKSWSSPKKMYLFL